MTETCLPIVNWLKNWFKPLDEDYQYNITSSDYNPTIDSTVTITVTVTDGDDNLVDNHSFTLNANGTDVSLTTSSGVATYSYTCSDWGVCRFSVKSFSTIINVNGWRIVHNDGIYYLKYNDKMVYALINYSTSVNWSTTVGHLGAEWLQDRTRGIDLRPPMPISVSPAPNKNIMIANNDYRVQWFTNSGTATGGLYAHWLYGRK